MKRTLLLLAASAMFIVSCGKDDAQPETNAISGNYDFVGMSTTGTTEAELPEDKVKTITTFAYDAISPKGTATIDVHKIDSKDWTYSVNTVITGKTYTDGVQTGLSSQPYEMDVPASSSTGTYKLIGTDSIFFDKGFVTGAAVGGQTPAAAIGYKLSWAGDTLIMRAAVDTAYTEEQFDLIYHMHVISKVEVRLKKKS